MPQDGRESEGFFQGRTKMPIYVGEDPPFISWAELKVNIHQLLTVIISLVLWYLAGTMTTSIPFLPFTMTFALIIWGWIPIGAVVLAFGHRKGMPLEKYIADRIHHALTARVYVPMDDSAEHGAIDEWKWE